MRRGGVGGGRRRVGVGGEGIGRPLVGSIGEVVDDVIKLALASDRGAPSGNRDQTNYLFLTPASMNGSRSSEWRPSVLKQHRSSVLSNLAQPYFSSSIYYFAPNPLNSVFGWEKKILRPY